MRSFSLILLVALLLAIVSVAFAQVDAPAAVAAAVPAAAAPVDAQLQQKVNALTKEVASLTKTIEQFKKTAQDLQKEQQQVVKKQSQHQEETNGLIASLRSQIEDLKAKLQSGDISTQVKQQVVLAKQFYDAKVAPSVNNVLQQAQQQAQKALKVAKPYLGKSQNYLSVVYFKLMALVKQYNPLVKAKLVSLKPMLPPAAQPVFEQHLTNIITALYLVASAVVFAVLYLILALVLYPFRLCCGGRRAKQHH